MDIADGFAMLDCGKGAHPSTAMGELCKDSLSNREVLWAIVRNLKRLSRRTTTDCRLPLYLRDAAI
jgi:hypothetical protein